MFCVMTTASSRVTRTPAIDCLRRLHDVAGPAGRQPREVPPSRQQRGGVTAALEHGPQAGQARSMVALAIHGVFDPLKPPV